MKQVFILIASLLMAIMVTSSISATESAENPGPEIIKLKMGGIYLPFKHWKHQKLAKNECSPCHKTEEWKIKKWDKEIAHQICISCHDLYEKGPVECKDCHGSAYTSLQKQQK